MELRDELLAYYSKYEEELISRSRMLEFLATGKRCFSRDSKKGHFTASGFLLNHDRSNFLLMHHKKLNMWLQPGGHADGNSNLLCVASKEVQEESGIMEIKVLSDKIFDIDIHYVGAHGVEEGHLHYDVRYLFQTKYHDNFVKNDEARELRWLDLSRNCFRDLKLDTSVIRMIKKCQERMYHLSGAKE